MTDLKLLSMEKEKVVFIVDDIVLANTLRRLITDEVPVMAIEDVEFIKNGSALYDEILAHRLGLIPLKTDLKHYNKRKDCKCEGKGCVLCTCTLTLDIEGPCTVYAEDLKTKDPNVKPIFPKIPIVKLLKDQKLELNATAVVGSGKEHSKFIPAHVYYRYYPIIKLDNIEDEKVVSVCPKHVYKIVGKKVQVVNEIACDMCLACKELSDKITIEGDKNRILFTLEPFGQLTPKEILLEALETLNKKLTKLKKVVEA